MASDPTTKELKVYLVEACLGKINGKQLTHIEQAVNKRIIKGYSEIKM